jgi:hypothetical protein
MEASWEPDVLVSLVVGFFLGLARDVSALAGTFAGTLEGPLDLERGVDILDVKDEEEGLNKRRKL